MINKNKYILAALSATSIIGTFGTGNIHADSKIGEVTAYSLNVRSGPSTSYNVIGGLKKGDKVEILSSDNGWYRIKYGSKTAWVSGKYISTENTPTNDNDNISSIGKKFVATTGLNVRLGGSTKYEKIGYIKKNSTVDVIGVAETGWYKVRLSDGTIGYSSNKYLKEKNNISGNVDNNTSLDYVIATVNLNVRSGPSRESRMVGVIYKGEKVSLLEKRNDGWYKIKLSSGKIGYSSSKYLKTQNELDSATNKPGSSNDISSSMKVKAYAYCTGNITSTGTKPTFGRTIAVDPKVIPYGSRVYIPEFDKTFIAEDCGGGIKGNKIDIYMNTEKECINWGVRNITIYILK